MNSALPLAWEEPMSQASESTGQPLYADVVFDRPIDHAFTYAVPDALRGAVGAGRRVEAPFGRGDRRTIGFCVRVHDQAPLRDVKELDAVLDSESLITEPLMRLTRWMADYYLCSWGSTLFAVVPAGAREKAGVREAVVLEAVPEAELPKLKAALTAQQIAALKHLRRGRCGEVAVLHSHLGDVERGGYWRRIAAGHVQVVVGARSAVFAPTQKLGLIIIDEEHEHTFKQEATPRYHGRDVAVMRARLENIPIVMGSATPSLESWNNAQRGQHTLLTLPLSVLDRPLPDVELIDLRHDGPPSRTQALSPKLEKAMRDAL